MPVGIYIKEQSDFTNYCIELEKNDVIYLFTDGYKDQTDIFQKQKFLSKNFRQFLFDIHLKTMTEQKQALMDNLYQWKKDSPQIDDILVFGLRI